MTDNSEVQVANSAADATTHEYLAFTLGNEEYGIV